MKGSVRPRGHDPKKWTLVFDVPRDAGKRKQVRVSFDGTFRAAQAQLRKLCAEVDEGRYISSRETVGEYLTFWLVHIKGTVMVESGADDDLAPNSYVTYERHCRVHIIPMLGHLPLKTLGTLDVDEALLKWRATQKEKGGGTLSKRSVFNIFATLRTALNQAVEWGKISKNPCTRKVKRGKSQPSANTEEDLAVLLTSLREHHLFVPCLFLATTAVRRNEMLALTRDMVDLDAGLAVICQAQTKLLDGGPLVFKTTKTDRIRTVTLSRMLVDALRRHFAETTDDLVFPWPGRGGHWHFSTFSTALRDAGIAAGVTTSAQRLRRLFSELADSSGAGDRTISNLMGNSPEVIARHYNAREVAKLRQVTDFVGARVTTLVTNPDLGSENP